MNLRTHTRIDALKLAVLLTAFVLAGCSGSSDTGSGKQFLSIGTAPTGGAFYVVGNAIAEAVNNNTGGLPWRVSSESTKGTQENIRRLDKGELDFALANAAISYFAVRGEGAWEKEYALRSVMTLAPNVALFVTPKSSGIKRISDLKGQRVVVGPAGAGFEYFIKPILSEHGITYDDFTPLNSTQTGAVDMLADGSAAAAFLGGAVPTASITQASASQEIFFVPFDQEARQKLIEDYPFFFPATIPAGTYRGQEQPFEGLNVGSMHLVTDASVPEETVYQFTKILYENRQAVVKGHPAGKAINAKNVIRDTGTPFHPGSIRYYKEIGIWTQDAGSD